MLQKIIAFLYAVYNIILVVAIHMYNKGNKIAARNMVIGVVISHFVVGTIKALVDGLDISFKNRYEFPYPNFRGISLLISDVSLLFICIPLLLLGRFDAGVTIAFFGNILCLVDYLTI